MGNPGLNKTLSVLRVASTRLSRRNRDGIVVLCRVVETQTAEGAVAENGDSIVQDAPERPYPVMRIQPWGRDFAHYVVSKANRV